jgi:hypothetical protein
MNQLGFTQIPDNIIVSKEGRILEHGLNIRDLMERLEKLLK